MKKYFATFILLLLSLDAHCCSMSDFYSPYFELDKDYTVENSSRKDAGNSKRSIRISKVHLNYESEATTCDSSMVVEIVQISDFTNRLENFGLVIEILGYPNAVHGIHQAKYISKNGKKGLYNLYVGRNVARLKNIIMTAKLIDKRGEIVGITKIERNKDNLKDQVGPNLSEYKVMNASNKFSSPKLTEPKAEGEECRAAFSFGIEEGVTILQLYISNEGEPLNVSIRESSGVELLDEAAINIYKKCKYIPAKDVNGASVNSWLTVRHRWRKL